jgi:hypothetical protein
MNTSTSSVVVLAARSTVNDTTSRPSRWRFNQDDYMDPWYYIRALLSRDLTSAILATRGVVFHGVGPQHMAEDHRQLSAIKMLEHFGEN